MKAAVGSYAKAIDLRDSFSDQVTSFLQCGSSLHMAMPVEALQGLAGLDIDKAYRSLIATSPAVALQWTTLASVRPSFVVASHAVASDLDPAFCLYYTSMGTDFAWISCQVPYKHCHIDCTFPAAGYHIVHCTCHFHGALVGDHTCPPWAVCNSAPAAEGTFQFDVLHMVFVLKGVLGLGIVAHKDHAFVVQGSGLASTYLGHCWKGSC